MILYEYDNDGWYAGWIDTDNPPPFPSTRTKTDVDYAPIEPAYARWVDGHWIEDQTKEIARVRQQLVAEAIAKVQTILDTYAQSWGYDSIQSAVSYVGDLNIKFHNEGIVLRNWRSETWTIIENNQTSITTWEQLLALLPIAPPRPTSFD